MPDVESSIAHYNEIPVWAIGKTILDIGSSDCYGAYHSKYKSHFIGNDFQGVDVQEFDNPYFPVIHADFRSWECSKRYDTVLLLHVLEHFNIEEWKSLFDKVLGMLNDDGYLVVNVPYKLPAYENASNEYMSHKVGDIDETLLLKYCTFMYFEKWKVSRTVIFRNRGENYIRSVLRMIKRIATNHKYSPVKTWFFPRCCRIVAVYKKGGSHPK